MAHRSILVSPKLSNKLDGAHGLTHQRFQFVAIGGHELCAHVDR